MKETLRFLLLLAGLAAAVEAEELRLTDGRSFSDSKIVSQTARRVVILHKNTMVSVAKELLPEDLRKQYPIDLILEAREQAKAEDGRKAALAAADAAKLRRAEQEKRLQKEAELEAKWKEQVNQHRSKAYAVGTNLVEAYFKNTRGTLMGARSNYLVTIEEARMVDGNLTRWELSGTVTVRNLRDFSLFGSTEERLKYYADDKSLSARELRQRRADMEYINTECYRFTATLEDIDGEPKASVWTR